MGLEEGLGKTADKDGSEIRISRLGGQGPQEEKITSHDSKEAGRDMKFYISA